MSRITADRFGCSRSDWRNPCCDTMARLAAAVALYRTLGFVDIPAYTFNPEADVTCLERVL